MPRARSKSSALSNKFLELNAKPIASLTVGLR